MSLYLQVAIGNGRYLIDADQVIEIVETIPSVAQDALPETRPIPTLDLRELFAATAGGNGTSMVVRQASDEPVALIVDRVENLVEVGDGEFRPLPPIGPAGLLIDAICGPRSDARPMLRLHPERALAARKADRA